MKYLKQPIARRANVEDGCTGHFFEQRFYSGVLLSEAAVVSAMAYVDLNPIRAKLTNSLDGSDCASISVRLKRTRRRGKLLPLFSGLRDGRTLNLTLKKYVARLHLVRHAMSGGATNRNARLWCRRVESVRRRQRVFGSKEEIQFWLELRGLQAREPPLPS